MFNIAYWNICIWNRNNHGDVLRIWILIVGFSPPFMYWKLSGKVFIVFTEKKSPFLPYCKKWRVQLKTRGHPSSPTFRRSLAIEQKMLQIRIKLWFSSGSASGPFLKPVDLNQSRTRLDHWHGADALGKSAPQCIRGLLATWPELKWRLLLLLLVKK